jgi:hypothetical protein
MAVLYRINYSSQHRTTYQQKEETEKGPPLPTARDRLTGQEIGGPPTPSKGILTVNFNILTFYIFRIFIVYIRDRPQGELVFLQPLYTTFDGMY